jgi:hypothetical protein
MPIFEWERGDEPPILTPEEWDVYSLLSEAWNRFIELPIYHRQDHIEFAQSVNALKNIVMSRPVCRELQKQDWPGYEKE